MTLAMDPCTVVMPAVLPTSVDASPAAVSMVSAATSTVKPLTDTLVPPLTVVSVEPSNVAVIPETVASDVAFASSVLPASKLIAALLDTDTSAEEDTVKLSPLWMANVESLLWLVSFVELTVTVSAATEKS